MAYDSKSAEVKLFSEKLHRFGTVGAGIIPDHMATLRLAKEREENQAQEAEGKIGSAGSDGKEADDASPARTPIKPARPPGGMSKNLAAAAGTGELSREQVLEVIEETVRVQGIVQEEVSALARSIAKERSEKKHKKRSLSFIDAHKKIVALDLPREPLEELGFTDTAFQKILLTYEEDEDVMTSAQKLLHPSGKGDPKRAEGISMEKIIEVHQFMVQEMQKVLAEFLQLGQEVRRSFTGKGCETTAELLVSIAVEQQLGVRCDDVEQAVIRYEETLQNHPSFMQCTECLAQMMQDLISAAQPRADKADFIKILKHMGESTRSAKAFAKKLFEAYQAKTCDIVKAYQRFEEFSAEATQALSSEELPDLSSTEISLCYDEYREDQDVQEAWKSSGVEANLMMKSMMTPGINVAPPPEESKKKVKISEFVEMQELMVDKLTAYVRAADEAFAKENQEWRAEIAIQMVQALASEAVEHIKGISAEEMTLAGFRHTEALQKSERFCNSSRRQQELLMKIAGLCGEQLQ